MARAFLCLAALATLAPAASARGPEIRLDDVDLFYRVYSAAGGHPSAEQLDRDYLGKGSAGLHEFARLRNVTGARMADALAKHPEYYTGARKCLETLPAVKRRLTIAFTRLARLYPEAAFPPVTILVGRGRPVGITNPSGVSVGLEALCMADFMNPDPEDRFVHVIAHEYGHTQQSAAGQKDLEPGDPGATVLALSLIEGAGELTAKLISGDVANHGPPEEARGHEVEIGRRFLADQDKTDVSAWLYNAKPGAPGDLGYYVGFRIVKAYYDRAADKHLALADIYAMRDPKQLLAKSGWKPGD